MCNTDTCCSAKGKGLASINRNRGCTDVLFLLLFLVATIGVFVLCFQAKGKGGNPDKIIKAVNMDGKICGVDDQVKESPLGAWPHPIYYKNKICVKSCDETSNKDKATNPSYSKMAHMYKSKKFLSYCVPDVADAALANLTIAVSGEGKLADAGEAAQRHIGDVFTAKWVIFGSAGIALVVTFFFMVILRRFAGLMVATCLLLVILGGSFVGWTLFSWGTNDDPTTSTLNAESKKLCKIIGASIGAAVLIFVLVLCFLKQQLMIAIEVVKEAAHAVQDMKTIIFFPIAPMIAAILYMILWIYTALYLYSVSNLEEQPTNEDVRTYQFTHPEFKLRGPNIANDNPAKFQRFVFDTKMRNALGFHVFHLLWMAQFLFYFGYLVFAGATADWYFTPITANGEKVRGENVGELTNNPVRKSCWRVFRYHMGTVALCSMIIATIQFLRMVIMYIEQKTKGDPPNKVQQCMFKCIQCCLKCVECCMDKINKNALIWVAIYGDSFGTAACSSFALVWRNLARVAAISTVGNLITLFGKFCVAVMTSGICLIIMTKVEPYKSDLQSPTIPAVLALFFAWQVASLFFVVFSSTVDTMFICFLVDAEVNSAGNMMAPASLAKLVGKHQADSQHKAQKMEKNRGERPSVKAAMGKGSGEGTMAAL